MDEEVLLLKEFWCLVLRYPVSVIHGTSKACWKRITNIAEGLAQHTVDPVQPAQHLEFYPTNVMCVAAIKHTASAGLSAVSEPTKWIS